MGSGAGSPPHARPPGRRTCLSPMTPGMSVPPTHTHAAHPDGGLLLFGRGAMAGANWRFRQVFGEKDSVEEPADGAHAAVSRNHAHPLAHARRSALPRPSAQGFHRPPHYIRPPCRIHTSRVVPPIPPLLLSLPSAQPRSPAHTDSDAISYPAANPPCPPLRRGPNQRGGVRQHWRLLGNW